MDRYIDEFNVISEAAAEKQRADSFADLNHEIADVDTGRNHRFLPPDQAEHSEKAKDKARRRLQTMLDLLLLNPEYAAAYQAADNALREAEEDAASQIELAQRALEEAEAALDDVVNRAARLPDGTRVYFDPATGQIMTEDGRALTDAQTAQIELNGNEPTYTEYLEAKRKVGTAQERLDSWYEYQVVLGGYRDEMSDTDNPPSIERLDEIQVGIQQNRPEVAAPELDQVDAPDQPELGDPRAVTLPTITTGG